MIIEANAIIVAITISRYHNLENGKTQIRFKIPGLHPALVSDNYVQDKRNELRRTTGPSCVILFSAARSTRYFRHLSKPAWHNRASLKTNFYLLANVNCR